MYSKQYYQLTRENYFILSEFSTQLILATLLRGVKRPGREADNSSPSSAEVPKQRSYTSNPGICIYGMCRETFAFYRGTHWWQSPSSRGNTACSSLCLNKSVHTSYHFNGTSHWRRGASEYRRRIISLTMSGPWTYSWCKLSFRQLLL